MIKIIFLTIVMVASMGLVVPQSVADDPPIPTPILGPFADSYNMAFLSQLTPTELGVTSEPIWDEYSLSDIWGWVSPNGEEYALIGTIDGLSIVRVTDPQNPEFMGMIRTFYGPSETSRTLWRDVKIYDHPDGDDPRGHAKAPYTGYVYMTTEAIGEGILIFELNKLDAMPAWSVLSSPLVADAIWDGGGYEAAHNIYVNQQSGYGYLTAVHFGGADNACDIDETAPDARFQTHNTLVVDLAANPLNPPIVACLQEIGGHDIYVVNYKGPDKDYTHHEIAFVFDGNEREPTGFPSRQCYAQTPPERRCDPDHTGLGGLLIILDVTDKNDIKVISSINVDGVCYSHQGWTTKNNEFLLINDEVVDTGLDSYSCSQIAGNDNAGLAVVDITDLDDPQFSKRFELDLFGNAHNFMVVKKHLYWAAYSGGTRVLELKRTNKGGVLDLQLTEVAYMDTEPRDYPWYLGQWGTFAFEKSGTIIASDVVNGLIVMKVD